MCDTKKLLEIAEELFIGQVRAHGSPDVPKNLEEIGVAIVEYKTMYLSLLKTICDDLPAAIK